MAQLPGVTLGPAGGSRSSPRAPTPLDRRATVRLSGDVVRELTALLGALGLGAAAQLAPVRPPSRVSAAPPPAP